jgi:hypothetical protein
MGHATVSVALSTDGNLTNHDHLELQDITDDTLESYYRLKSP